MFAFYFQFVDVYYVAVHLKSTVMLHKSHAEVETELH